MIILGIETSCDETAAAIIRATTKTKPVTVLSNIISTSLEFHAQTGGIIPEVAAREQLKFIIPVIDQAINEAQLGSSIQDLRPGIDAIAVTYGPGLIGSLLVGVETAKSLSYAWNKPLIPVNHLYGHLYANWIETPDYRLPTTAQTENSTVVPLFPAIGLIISGGHTDLVLMKDHGHIEWLGGTRDDAAGEAFDKIGRMLGLPYPSGHLMEQKAKHGDPKRFTFPRPMIGTNDFDFSFSGLKAAASREITRLQGHSELVSESPKGNSGSPSGTTRLDDQTINDICAGIQEAIIRVVVKKTIRAAEKHQVKSILLGGGVAANQTLTDRIAFEIGNLKLDIALSVPTKHLCTDNAAMIATAGFYNYKEVSWKDLTPNPELHFD